MRVYRRDGTSGAPKPGGDSHSDPGSSEGLTDCGSLGLVCDSGAGLGLC